MGVEKFGKMIEISKVFYTLAVLFGVLVTVFMTMSNSRPQLATFCALFGVFGFGMYPIALELSVEATYPIDESIGTALIFLSGQLQGGILIFVSEMLELPLGGEALLNEVCSSRTTVNISDFATASTTLPKLTTISTLTTGSPTQPTSTSDAADHTHFLIVLAVYLVFLCFVFVTFFKTEFKRTKANEEDAAVVQKQDNFGFEVDSTGF